MTEFFVNRVATQTGITDCKELFLSLITDDLKLIN